MVTEALLKPTTSGSTSVPAPLGVLKISSVGIEVPVLERTDDLTLNRAVGHIDGTPYTGEEGNIRIAVHLCIFSGAGRPPVGRLF